MADNREASLCLPAEFLTDDDILTGEFNHTHQQLPSEFPYDFADQNDYCTEFTRRLALSTLLNSNNKLNYSSSPASEKKWSLSGSPQSILSPVMSNKSLNLPSPTGPFALNRQSMDVISAAAVEINAWKAKNNISIENKALPPPFNFTPYQSPNNTIPVKQNCGSIWAQSSKVTADYSCGFNVSVRCESVNHPLECRRPNFSVQRQQCNVNSCVNGDGLVFSGGRRYFAAGGGVGFKKKSAGTGVFLPRRYPDSTDSRVKSGCPSSLNTPKTAQELNVNNGNVMSQAKARAPFMSGPIPDHDAMIMRRNAMLVQQWRNNMNMMANGAVKGEMPLPEKWSY